jgi:hypothetical protein
MRILRLAARTRDAKWHGSTSVTGASLERRVEHLEDACYTELSPLERFRLILDAGARDDFEAADRLWDACPTRTYRQADAAFSGRVRAAELICLAVYADLNYLLGGSAWPKRSARRC